MIALWFLAAFGFAYVVGHSKISLGIRMLLGGHESEALTVECLKQAERELRRELKDPPGPIPEELIQRRSFQNAAPLIPKLGPWLAALMECVACVGWWLGLGAGFLGVLQLGVAPWFAALILAFATSAVNLLLGKFVGIV